MSQVFTQALCRGLKRSNSSKLFLSIRESIDRITIRKSVETRMAEDLRKLHWSFKRKL